MMAAGVDACRGGWVAVLVTLHDDVVDERVRIVGRFEELLESEDRLRAVAVDCPIGLLQHPVPGGRECDRAARQVLGWPRSSSVFSPPSRGALKCATWEEARRRSLSRQSFSILPKVRELDRWMTVRRQGTVREAHPEICFFALNGLRPLGEGKKSPEGSALRRHLLERVFPQVGENLSSLPGGGVKKHDLLDAYACAWTAVRILRGLAVHLPADPPVDARGLQMAIWY